LHREKEGLKQQMIYISELCGVRHDVASHLSH